MLDDPPLSPWFYVAVLTALLAGLWVLLHVLAVLPDIGLAQAAAQGSVQTC